MPVPIAFGPDAARAGPKAVLLYWGRRGGGSLFTLELAQTLQAGERPMPVVCSLSSSNVDLARFSAAGIRFATIDLPGLSSPAGWLSLPRRLRAHANDIAALRPDLAIVTMNAAFAWPFSTMLRRRGVKVAYVAHDAAPHPGDYAAAWQRATQRRLVAGADCVVTLSAGVRRRLAAAEPGIENRSWTIPLEAVAAVRRSVPQPPPPDGEPMRLLFYGRLLPYKGLGTLSEALRPLSSDPGWRLTIAGAGPMEAAVRSLFLGWPQVELELGWVSDERAAHLFRHHHVLVCPYAEASQSGVVAQALSWGMPAVVMPAGSLPEQIGMGRAGLVVPEATAAALTGAIRQLIAGRARLPELSQGALELIGERRAEDGWRDLVDAAAARAGEPGRGA